MGVLSKPSNAFREVILKTFSNKKTGIPTLSVIILILYIFNNRNKKLARDLKMKTEGTHSGTAPGKKKSGNVDLVFLQNFIKIMKIVMPKTFSLLTLEMVLMLICLILRTFLSIHIASINGSFVRSIVDRNLRAFSLKILRLVIIAIPASVLNSYLEYLRKSIAYRIRTNLTLHFHNTYMQSMRFYQVFNIDGRIENPDQRLTNDIEKFSMAFSNMYSNITKPILDIFLFGQSLAKRVGYSTVSLTFLWYIASGMVLKFISPPMGLLTAIQQNMEGGYRAQHSNIVSFNQEIAFLSGAKYEKTKLKQKFNQLYEHEKDILQKRLYLGSFDGLLVKYGATIVGYYVLSKPSMRNFKKKDGKLSISELTQDYIRNGSLMMNLAKSIGRMVISYKDLQNMAGYTILITEMQTVLNDLENGKYMRSQASTNTIYRKNISAPSIEMANRGTLIISQENKIRFDNVPLITPTGDMLIESMSFALNQGENLIISGPNGCGKSSLFRILGGLWPLMGGVVERPRIEELFYLPQRPYLTEGTLKEQIIYPFFMNQDDYNDDQLKALLDFVELTHLYDNLDGGLIKERDWEQVLSGGEKQMIAMARLLFHKPKFAILDECTSTVSVEMESKFYKKAKEIGISLFTISHRQSLFQFHDFYLKFDGDGSYSWINLRSEREASRSITMTKDTSKDQETESVPVGNIPKEE
jgi:ATP-binding cassette subfamily D (ALD) protein 3